MGALSSLATVGLNLALAQQSARRSSRAVESERDRQIRTIQQQDAEALRREEEQLRRRLAAQRARAAASGVGGLGGSTEAVLRGLTEESAAAQRARETQSALRVGDLRRDASSARRRNLLDLASDATQSSLRVLGRRSGQRSSLLDL